MKILRIVVVVALLAVGIGAVYFAVAGRTNGGSAATRYITSPASRRDVTVDVAADGTVSASRTYSLAFGAKPTSSTAASSSASSSSSGGGGGSGTWTVTKVSVAVGDPVRKGQKLATATSADLTSQLAAAHAQLSAASIQYSQARTTLDDALGTSGEDQARAAMYQARASYTSAKQSVADLEAQVALGTLTAPADGTVTDVAIQAGLDAPSGAAITIATTPLVVTADVTEDDLPSLSIGQPASVTVSAVGATVDGTVSAIAPVSASSNGSSVVTYAVTIQLSQPPAAVRSGMSAQVSVTTASATNVLAVPTIALQGTAGNYSVQVLDAAGQPQAMPVTVGLISSRYAEIKDGLTDGQAVVIGSSSERQSTASGTGGNLGFPVGAGGLGGGGFRGGNGGNGPVVVKP